MSKGYVVAVLDYMQGEVDIFRMRIGDDEDVEEMVIWGMKQFGHATESCHYMYSPEDKPTRIHIDI